MSYQVYAEGLVIKFVGFLGQTLVVKTTKEGKRYCLVGVSVNNGNKKVNDSWEKDSGWMNFTIFDNDANKRFLDAIEKLPEAVNFTKGSLVEVVGNFELAKIEEYKGTQKVVFKLKDLHSLLKVGGGKKTENNNNEDVSNDNDDEATGEVATANTASSKDEIPF